MKRLPAAAARLGDLADARALRACSLAALAVAGAGCHSSGGASEHDASVLGEAATPQRDAAPDVRAEAAVDAGPPPPDAVAFPATFLWGSATAGFQVESGDSHTDWAAWVATAGKIQHGDAPDVGGPDALNHIAADVADLVASGQNAYRFSVEWGRLYPTLADFEADTPDPAAVTAYSSLLSALVAAHITPVVTLQHFTLPSYLDDPTQSSQPQGWENAQATTLYVEFCSRIAKRWGAQVDDWITINEPLVLAISGYLAGDFPPGVLLSVDRTLAVAKAEALAHVQAYDAIHAADTVDANGDGVAARVSVAKHQRTFHPADPTSAADVAATTHVEYLWNRWFLNVIVDGDWDDDFDGTLTGPNDKTADPALKGRADFLGINYYSDTIISASEGLVLPAPLNASIQQSNLPTDRPKTDVGWDIYAAGFGTVIDEARTWGLPILVTENGIADASDTNRPRFLLDHLFQLGWAMQRGANVIGYLHWASVDNFEWVNGFCPKFGFYAYDPATQVRTARPSASTYAGVIKSGSVTLAQLNAAAPYVTPSTTCVSAR